MILRCKPLGAECALLLLMGCSSVEGVAPAASKQQTAPATASAKRGTTKQNLSATDEYRITAEQMGRVRMGITVGQLKRIFPKATFRNVIMEDIPSVVAVSQRSEILFYFVSYPNRAEPPADNDVINFMMTDNPRYATAAGIRPGSLLQNAVKTYGSVKLYYSPDAEHVAFQRSPESATSEMGFRVVRPKGKPSAGVYKWNNKQAGDCQTALSGYCESTRFNLGAKISYITIAAKRDRKFN